VTFESRLTIKLLIKRYVSQKILSSIIAARDILGLVKFEILFSHTIVIRVVDTVYSHNAAAPC